MARGMAGRKIMSLSDSGSGNAVAPPRERLAVVSLIRFNLRFPMDRDDTAVAGEHEEKQ